MFQNVTQLYIEYTSLVLIIFILVLIHMFISGITGHIISVEDIQIYCVS